MSRSNDMAYPVPSDVVTPNNTEQLGLTIREHFAAIAMQGMCAHFGTCGLHDIAETARRSVMVADALIVELAKDQS